MSIEDSNLKAIAEAVSEKLNKDEIEILVLKGELMNKTYKLTGDNAYPNDLNLVSIPNLYDPIFKINNGARWFNDIVDNNAEREKQKRRKR